MNSGFRPSDVDTNALVETADDSNKYLQIEKERRASEKRTQEINNDQLEQAEA